MESRSNVRRKRCGLSAAVTAAGSTDNDAANTSTKKVKASQQPNSITTNAATAVLSASERVRRWPFIGSRCPTTDYSSLQQQQPCSFSDTSAENDPYNMDDLVIPSIASNIEHAIKGAMEQWKELDSRRVPNEGNGIDKPPKRRLGWNEPKFFLPDHFDYKSVRGPPTTEQLQQSYPRDMVLSLDGDCPGEMQDYERELWNIFDAIPTEQQLLDNEEENSTRSTSSIGKTRLQTQILKEEIEKGMKRHSTLDGHCLSRLRMRDMNHFPPRITLENRSEPRDVSINASMQDDSEAPSVTTATGTERNKSTNMLEADGDSIILRIECWKRSLKRGSSADYNKLELEFYGSQTLLDVHRAIQENTKDVLDRFFRQWHAIKRSTLPGPGTTMPPTTENSSYNPLDDLNARTSGVFFIENVFYTTGPADYCTPIIKWLRAGYETDKDNASDCIFTPRDKVLGITPTNKAAEGAIVEPFEVKEMHNVHLKDIPIRLGVRYFHAFNGNLQTSIFFSDVIYHKDSLSRKSHTSNPENDTAIPVVQQDRGHPSIMATTLDTWAFPSYTNNVDVSICQGCSHSIAVVVCLDDELTDGSPTSLCAYCYHNLHYTSTGSLRYNNFRAFPIELTYGRLLSVREEQNDSSF
jgi:DNA-nicking Smr family endonuclease